MRISHSYAELNGIWNLLDSDGNGIVSLAEVQKLVITKFPLRRSQQWTDTWLKFNHSSWSYFLGIGFSLFFVFMYN